jgi:hypothetical protein
MRLTIQIKGAMVRHLSSAPVVRPDGTLLAYQPDGERGLLIAEIDITAATGLLSARCNLSSF